MEKTNNFEAYITARLNFLENENKELRKENFHLRKQIDDDTDMLAAATDKGAALINLIASLNIVLNENASIIDVKNPYIIRDRDNEREFDEMAKEIEFVNSFIKDKKIIEDNLAKTLDHLEKSGENAKGKAKSDKELN